MGVRVSTDTARSSSSTAAPAMSPRDTWSSRAGAAPGPGAAEERPWASSSASISRARATTRADNYVRRAVEFIQGNYCNPIRITDVADYVCINRSYLYTLFHNATGMSPQQFLTAFRVTKATELLQLTDLPVESIALSCGYTDPLVFSKSFKQMKQMSPSAYRREMQKGETRRNKEYLKQIEDFINQVNKLNS